MEIRTDPNRLSADQIRYLIQELGLSQERFAAQIGSTRATVWHWVNGRRMPSHMACQMMRLVADEFAISIPEDKELTIFAKQSVLNEDLFIHSDNWLISFSSFSVKITKHSHRCVPIHLLI